MLGDTTVCTTRYRTRNFFNSSNTNEDIATKFEQEYVCCVRNEKECVCSVCLFRCNILISGKIIKEIPGSVASGTSYIKRCCSSRSNYLIKTYKIYEEPFLVYFAYFIRSFVIVFKNT
jgi:hypothetical protein